jgi:MoaA/NifB/PqqE/SkfB family radical SAM enzyme
MIAKYRNLLARLNRRFEPRRAYGYPQNLQLSPTNACNLRCSNCPKTYHPTNNQHMPPDVYRRVKEQLFPHVNVLDLQGLGEPTMAPLFPQMLEDARRHRLRVRFTTNATLLKPPMIEELVAMGAEVTVSLDGALAQTHEESRPGADFEKVVDVLTQFRRAMEKQRRSGFELSINTVVSVRNVGELPEVLSLAAKCRACRLTLINPGVGERNDEFAKAAIGKHPELLRGKIAELRSQAQEVGIHLIYPAFFNETPLPVAAPAPAAEKMSGNSDRLFPGKCFDPWQMVYIDVDGWVRPCCRAIWLGMGNIMETPFKEIWQGRHYLLLREHVNSNCPPDFCRNCVAAWGITRGDEAFCQKLARQGVRLPDPPVIGVTYAEED